MSRSLASLDALRDRGTLAMIDAHNHLDFEAFAADRAAVIAEARASGIVASVLAGTHPETWERTRAVAKEGGDVAVLGVHPAWADRVADWDDIVAALEKASPVGIGEIGLDRRVTKDLAWQQAGLRAQLAMARATDRPVIFHCVRAYPELLATIRRDGLPQAGGMIHGWTGPPDRVAEAVALGLSLSFGLAITHAHAPRQAASARATPADRLLVETDCPDTRPSKARGAPTDLMRVIEAVARARGESADAVAQTTHDNAARMFGMGRL
ncbi:MAG: TatD family hydrolase [Myxococcota bacterium]